MTLHLTLHFIATVLIVIVRAMLICFLAYGAFGLLTEARLIWKTSSGEATRGQIWLCCFYVGLGIAALCTMGLK